MTFRRPHDRRFARKGSPTPEQLVAALLPFSWARATNVTTSGGFTTELLDLAHATNKFTQASAPLQAATPASQAAAGGQLCVSFTAAQKYGSNLPASSWSFLHSGSGMHVFHIAVPRTTGTRVQLSTQAAGPAAASRGLALYCFATAGGTAAAVSSNGTAALYDTQTILAPVNAVVCREYFHSSAGSPQRGALKNGVLSDSGAELNAPSASDPAGTLFIGGSVGATSSYEDWAETIIFNRVLSAQDRAVVGAYTLSRYGI